MIVTSRVADPQIREAVRTGAVVSDDVAETIADWFKSPARPDMPFTWLAQRGAGAVTETELVALVHRVDSMLRDAQWRTSDALPDLHTLREWALCRVPHIKVTEYRMTGDEWDAWVGDEGGEDCDRERPAGIEPVAVDVTPLADIAESLADWVYPGDARYPENPEEFAADGRDPNGDGRWIPADLITAAVGSLSGDYVGFWAESYGGNPFDWNVYWHQSCRIEEEGTGRAYASRYADVYTGEVQITIAKLVGLTADEEVAVWHAWSGR
jgi:hypothetical protein